MPFLRVMYAMVADSFKKVKEWCVENRADLFVAGIIFFTGLSSFGLGRLSVDLKPAWPISVTDTAASSDPVQNAPSAGDNHADQGVLSSRNGSVYYYAWCSGAKRIKEENKIWFATREAAEKAGLKQAGNCSGL